MLHPRLVTPMASPAPAEIVTPGRRRGIANVIAPIVKKDRSTQSAALN